MSKEVVIKEVIGQLNGKEMMVMIGVTPRVVAVAINEPGIS